MLMVLSTHLDSDYIIVTYVIFRNNDRLPHDDEARAILSRFGEIAKIERLEERIQKLMGVPESLLVHFRKFDPRRDVIGVCPIIDVASSI
jgi:hypothetical protein